MIPSHVTLQAALSTTKRVPYSERDFSMLRAYKESVRDSNRDLVLHHSMGGALQEAARNGYILLTCPLLDTDFAFLKLDAGRGLFGGQKSRVMSYVGTIDLDELMPGTTFANFAFALSSINNIHRKVEATAARGGW
jgi:hypothetical protein